MCIYIYIYILYILIAPINAVLTLVSPCPLHWYYLCRYSNITTIHCLPDHNHSLTHTNTQPRRYTIRFTLWHSVALDPRSWIGDHVTVRSHPLAMAQPTHRQWVSFPSCVSVSKIMFVMTFKVCCSCMLQWMLNLMELDKLCCYAIKVFDFGWAHSGFHECSVRKLSKLLSDVLFLGGATLAIYIDCQQALPELRNFIITLF